MSGDRVGKTVSRASTATVAPKNPICADSEGAGRQPSQLDTRGAVRPLGGL